jgi:hypothetical protein
VINTIMYYKKNDVGLCLGEHVKQQHSKENYGE